ncbi:MAG: hypothetical protein Q8K75_01705 [Chlamydiales bacterium]|nr:hypothetical protein [Chlamydiales bacterium]
MKSQIYRRFVIIGLPGSGKSTFASKLGKRLGIPVHHLDRHMFVAGGKKRDKEEFLSIQREMVNEEAWIIEGCAMSSLEMRVAQADSVIYFHLPRLLCIWRAFKRFLTNDNALGDTAEGCSKVFNWELVSYIWNFDRDKRKDIEDLQNRYPQIDFQVFDSSKDAEDYLEKHSMPLSL